MGIFTLDLISGKVMILQIPKSTTGSTSGGDAYPVVSRFADLPPSSSNADCIYVVRTSTGSYSSAIKEAGLYISNGSIWNRIGCTNLFFNDANFSLYNATDATKQMKVNLSTFPTNTSITVTYRPISGIAAYLSDLESKLNISTFNTYTGNTLTCFNTVNNNVNLRMLCTDFDVYTGTTQTCFNTVNSNVNLRLLCSDFTTYCGNIQTCFNTVNSNINSRVTCNDFDAYTGSSASNLSNYLLNSKFNTYTGNTLTCFNTVNSNVNLRLLCSDFTTYCGGIQTCFNTVNGNINSRVTCDDFDAYTGSTIFDTTNFISCTKFNTYTGATLTCFNTVNSNVNLRLLCSDFTTYCGNIQTCFNTVNGNVNSRVSCTDFDAYTGSSASNLSNYLLNSKFNTYTGNTLTCFNTVNSNVNLRLLCSDFTTYCGDIQTCFNTVNGNINLRLLCSDFTTYCGDIQTCFNTVNSNVNSRVTCDDFDAYTGSTVFDMSNYITCPKFNTYTGDTQTCFNNVNNSVNSRVSCADFDSYTGSTVFDTSNYVTSCKFNAYTGSTVSCFDNIDTCFNSYLRNAKFNNYTGSTEVCFDGINTCFSCHVRNTKFNNYTGSTAICFDGINTCFNLYLRNAKFNSYTGSTETELLNITNNTNNRVKCSDYCAYTAQTQCTINSLVTTIGSEISFEEFSYYTGNTETCLNSLCNCFNNYVNNDKFNSFTANTISSNYRLNSTPFYQCTGDTLTLSGTTCIKCGSISIDNGYKISGVTVLNTKNSTTNIIVGVNSLCNLKSGLRNISIGNMNGGLIQDGTDNIFIGNCNINAYSYFGKDNISCFSTISPPGGCNNIIIGNGIVNNIIGSNKLYVGGVNQKGLIEGCLDVNNPIVKFNGKLFASFVGEGTNDDMLLTYEQSSCEIRSISRSSIMCNVSDLIIVKALCDLPTPVNNSICLTPNYTYYFDGNINICSNTIVLTSNNSLIGRNSNSNGIFGCGTVLISGSTSFTVDSLALNNNNISGKVFCFDGKNDNCGIISNSKTCGMYFGDIKRYKNLKFNNNTVLNICNGLSINGNDINTSKLCVSNNDFCGCCNDFTGLTINSGKFSTIIINNNTFVNENENTSISIPSSLCIVNLGFIRENMFMNDGKYVHGGLNKSNPFWIFKNNTCIEDSLLFGVYRISGNNTPTTIDALNTYYKAYGVNSSKYNERTEVTDNRITYTYTRPTTILIDVSGDLCVDSSVLKNTRVGVYKNGNELLGYTDVLANNCSYYNFIYQDMVCVSKDDYFEIWVGSSNSCCDVLIRNAQFRISGQL